MKKVLNVWLKKNQLTKAHNDYSAEVLIKGNLDAGNIVDELISEGLNINRDIALNFITQFNKKTTELALSGFKLDTGLVKILPITKGLIYGRKWSPYINSVSLAFTESFDLRLALTETKVEIVGEYGEPLKIGIVSDLPTPNTKKKYYNDRSIELRESNMKFTEDNESSIVFRKWLFKA